LNDALVALTWILLQGMLIMTSIIRVGQSKFVTVQIDEDSNERIMNCIQTLSELEAQPAVHEIFLTDTKAAFSKMLGAQEVRSLSFFKIA
jgi:coatomer subunit beta